MFRTSHRGLLLAGLGLIGAVAVNSPSAAAVVGATATTTFQVTATVQATCLISATSLAFGTYTGVQANASSTVTVTCTNTSPYNVGLNAGTTGGTTVTTRKMAGPAGALLGYSLFSDAARTINWGNTIGTDTVAGTGNGNAQALAVFGSVAAGQFVAPGAYADTITATVTF
jgi:spore coat protein U-like protein